MSDNLRRYRAIKERLFQLYRQGASGHLAQGLHVLAMFINGIVASKSTHIREVAKKTPIGAKVSSQEKQLSRWYQNEAVSHELYMLPFVKGSKGHLSSETHLSLLKQLPSLLPAGVDVVLFGDGE